MQYATVLALLLAAACDGGTIGGNSDGGGGGDDTPGDARRPDAPGGVGEPPELNGITLAHNNVRAMVQTTPALPALEWSSALAASAKAYTMMCIDADGNGLVDHNPNRSNGFPDYVGENIYASGGATATGDDAVQLWAEEAANYHYDTNACDAGKVCGHYTQLVWRGTTKVGCALVNCPGLQYPSTILCDYEPGGNIGGQSPY